MAAGILAQSGYFMGEELWPADIGNPKGQFEDREVNQINDELIASGGPEIAAPRAAQTPARRRPAARQLAALGRGAEAQRVDPMPARDERADRGGHGAPALLLQGPAGSRTPCRAWRPYIGDALLLCVFRDPASRRLALVRECKRADHMKGTAVDERWALKVWEAMYRYILDVHYPQGGDWLFVHYDQLLNHWADAELERRLGVTNRSRIRGGRAQPLATGRRSAAPHGPALRAAVRARPLRHRPAHRAPGIAGPRSAFIAFFPAPPASACR